MVIPAIPSTADQYWSNNNPFNWTKPVTGKRELKIVEEPVIIWKKEYEINPGKFLDLIQKISDYMLLNGNSLYNYENPNQPYLIDAVKGKLNKRDLETSEYIFGDKGTVPLRDNHFYYTSKTHLQGEVTAQPFKFGVKNVSIDSSAQIKKLARKGAKLSSNLFSDFALTLGTDLSFLQDKSVNVAGSAEEIYSRLNEQEKYESIIYKLLQDMNYRHDLQELAKESFGIKFDVNAEFGFLEVINNDIIPRYLEPHQVSWIANKRVKTLEDKAVIACAANDYISFTEMMNKYNTQLNTGTGARGILDAIERIRKGNLGSYDPSQTYFSEYYRASDVTSDYDWDNQRGSDYKDNIIRINHMNQCFYPFQRTGAALNYSILEQHLFFKMFVPTRYLIEFNGKSTTKRAYEKWLDGDFRRDVVPSFTELGIDEKAPKGQLVIDKPKTETWRATRLGHATLINAGRYEYETAKAPRGIYNGFPIVMQASYEKSHALLGYNFALWTDVAFQRIEEIMSRIGVSRAILVDQASGIDPVSFLYNAKKTGIALYNSSKMNGANATAARHLDVMQLGNDIEEISGLLSYVGMLKIMYENAIGASEQSQGIAQKYSGAKELQMNLANQGIMKAVKYREHYLYMNQLLQRAADIAKVLYSREDVITVTLSKGEKEFLRLHKDLHAMDMDVLLESGYDLDKELTVVQNAVAQVLSSGGIEMIDSLIDILLSDNPKEAREIFRKNKDLLVKLQQQQQQAQAQQAQMQAQVEAQKNQIPLQKEGIITERELALQHLRMQERSNSEDFKGHMQDIKQFGLMQDKYLDSDLRMTEASHGAALQDGLSENQHLRSREQPTSENTPIAAKPSN